MQEVPDPNILQDDDMDAEPSNDRGGRDGDDLDDFVDNDGDDNNNNDSDYDTDGDYVEDVGDASAAATAVLFGNRDNARRKGKKKKKKRNDEDNDEEEEEGEDLLDNALKDYQAIAALDTYGREGIDNREYGGMDLEERARAESILDQRDRERAKMAQVGGRSRGFYGALEDQMDGEVEEEDEDRLRRRGAFDRRGGGGGLDGEGTDDDGDGGNKTKDMRQLPDGQIYDDNFEEQEPVNLEAFDIPLREWIATQRARDEVMRKFRLFLSTYREGAEYSNLVDESLLDDVEIKRRKRLLAQTPPTYEERIRHMCSSNKGALEVSYMHLASNVNTATL